jgi:putative glycosyltransferase (TIGR04372 family)
VAAPARLPEASRRRVAAALARLGPAPRGSCCLYLRDKGGPQEWDSYVRSGGPLADYVPAIARLVERGYRVLLTGDRPLDAEIGRTFATMLVDGATIGIDPNLFSLYAATECDLWIGEDGGGTNVAMVADKPMLGINWFPYYAIFPDIVAFYKYLRDPSGTLVPPAELFTRFAFDQRCQGYTILNNTPAEIEAAVVDFVTRNEAGRTPGIDPATLGPMIEDIWFRYERAFVSEPWLRPFATATAADDARTAHRA